MAGVTVKYTSRSAVAERPRDALYPSVVSLNSVTPRAQSVIIVTSASNFHCIQLNVVLLSLT